MKPNAPTLWPEDISGDIDGYQTDNCINAAAIEPNTDLALMLLSAGSSIADIKKHCGFNSVRDAREWMNDPQTQKELQGAVRERRGRIGGKALVGLETLLDEGCKDPRAYVQAIRTGIDVAGLRDASMIPVRKVSELSVAELNELISTTERELQERISRRLPDGKQGQ